MYPFRETLQEIGPRIVYKRTLKTLPGTGFNLRFFESLLSVLKSSGPSRFENWNHLGAKMTVGLLTDGRAFVI
jgi:hypothetical protein